jgi:hypothetical protein
MRMSPLNRYCDYLSKVGVRVHSVADWSVAMDPTQAWYGHANSLARFHTTQDRVWLDGVEEKKRQICQGLVPYVTTITAPEFGAGDMWVSNGHHTLAAYLVLKRRPYVRCFTRAYGPAALKVNAPTFDRWA